MKKAASIIILLAVILFSFSFTYFKSQAIGPEDNYFNRHLRNKFAASPFLRQALGLHFDGDGKADYLGNRYQKISIEVDALDTINISFEALDILSKKIQSITGKQTSYIISDRNISYDPQLEEDELKKMADAHKNTVYPKGAAKIYLLYGSKDGQQGSLIGRTYQEYGIVIYGDTLADLTRRNHKLLSNYEASTALHEFGHLLGFSHNSERGCLMNASADFTDIGWQTPEEVVTDFCEYEKSMLQISE